jgi:hypothetical protein
LVGKISPVQKLAQTEITQEDLTHWGSLLPVCPRAIARRENF